MTTTQDPKTVKPDAKTKQAENNELDDVGRRVLTTLRKKLKTALVKLDDAEMDTLNTAVDRDRIDADEFIKSILEHERSRSRQPRG